MHGFCGHTQVLPLMKTLTFDIISSILFGLERGPQKYALGKKFEEMIAGLWAVPANLSFTTFNKSLHSRAHARSKGAYGNHLEEKGHVREWKLLSCRVSHQLFA